MKLRSTLGFLCVCLFSTAGYADDWYLGVRSSAANSELTDLTHKGTIGTGTIIDGEVDGQLRETDIDDVTAGFGFALGRSFGNWAIEADLHWRYRTDWDVNIPTPSIQTITNVQTDMQTTSLLINAIRTGALGENWRWELGLGAGMVHHSLESDYIERAGVAPQMVFSDDNSINEFAWSALAGLSRPIGKFWRISVRYRYSDFGELEVGPFPGRPGELFADYAAHEIYFSFERDLELVQDSR